MRSYEVQNRMNLLASRAWREYSVAKRTLYNWVSSGKLPSKVIYGQIYVNERILKKLLKKG